MTRRRPGPARRWGSSDSNEGADVVDVVGAGAGEAGLGRRLDGKVALVTGGAGEWRGRWPTSLVHTRRSHDSGPRYHCARARWSPA